MTKIEGVTPEVFEVLNDALLERVLAEMQKQANNPIVLNNKPIMPDEDVIGVLDSAEVACFQVLEQLSDEHNVLHSKGSVDSKDCEECNKNIDLLMSVAKKLLNRFQQDDWPEVEIELDVREKNSVVQIDSMKFGFFSQFFQAFNRNSIA